MTNSFRVSSTLIFFAIMGTVLSWLTTVTFLIEISFVKFFIIEVVISVFHSMYNKAKKELKQIK